MDASTYGFRPAPHAWHSVAAVRPEGFSVGLSPLPLSVTVSRISRSTTLSSAFTALQPKWRAALWMHSLKIRKRWRRASRLGGDAIRSRFRGRRAGRARIRAYGSRGNPDHPVRAIWEPEAALTVAVLWGRHSSSGNRDGRSDRSGGRAGTHQHTRTSVATGAAVATEVVETPPQNRDRKSGLYGRLTNPFSSVCGESALCYLLE